MTKLSSSLGFLFYALLLCGVQSALHAAPPPASAPKVVSSTSDPYTLFRYKNYRAALSGFLELAKNKSKDDLEIMNRIGLCYLNGSIDYKKAIEYLSAVAKEEKGDIEAEFNCGKAYQCALMFDEAIACYTRYLENPRIKSGAGFSELEKKAKRAIETCNNGKMLVANPVDVVFENLGKEINSPFDDLDPFITPNKTVLVYTSNRQEGNQCLLPRKAGFTSDLYLSSFKNGKWSKAVNMGSVVNTPLNERVVSINDDASQIFLYIDNEESTKDGDIYLAVARNKVFDTPFSLKGLVNSKDEESAASISDDGSTLIFSSDRPGGAGQKDLYIAKRLPDQSWGEPRRLKDNVNTPYNEDFPILINDDKTIYFCSEGHNSMGGLDIYRTDWIDTLNAWSDPVNLGYPVNTPEDNFSISFTSNKNEGFISSIRPEGMGGYDVYSIVFTQAEGAPYSVVKGAVKNSGTEVKSDVIVSVISSKTKSIVGKYNISAKKSGRFFGVFFPGEYDLEFNSPGLPTLNEHVRIIDKNTRGEILQHEFDFAGPKPKPAPGDKKQKK